MVSPMIYKRLRILAALHDISVTEAISRLVYQTLTTEDIAILIKNFTRHYNPLEHAPKLTLTDAELLEELNRVK